MFNFLLFYVCECVRQGETEPQMLHFPQIDFSLKEKVDVLRKKSRSKLMMEMKYILVHFSKKEKTFDSFKSYTSTHKPFSM